PNAIADSPPSTQQDPSSFLAGTTGAAGGSTIISVDEVTGAAVATIPFVLPPGRGGVNPTLALHYNSNRDEGDAGMGWPLDMPTIIRDMARGPNWNVTDGYYYNDTALLYVCTVGTSSCSTYSPNELAFPSWASGMYYFRPQVDSGWTRFFVDQGFSNF